MSNEQNIFEKAHSWAEDKVQETEEKKTPVGFHKVFDRREGEGLKESPTSLGKSGVFDEEEGWMSDKEAFDKYGYVETESEKEEREKQERKALMDVLDKMGEGINSTWEEEKKKYEEGPQIRQDYGNAPQPVPSDIRKKVAADEIFRDTKHLFEEFDREKEGGVEGFGGKAISLGKGALGGLADWANSSSDRHERELLELNDKYNSLINYEKEAAVERGDARWELKDGKKILHVKNNKVLEGIYDGANNRLTPTENRLLDMEALRVATNSYIESKGGLSGWYTAGEVTGGSVPFMIEMAITSAMTGGVGAPAVASRFPRLLKLAKWAKEAATGTSIMTAEHALQGRVGNDAASRQRGEVKVTTDENGNVKFDGFDNSKRDGAVTAWAKATTADATESFSEYTGGLFAPFGRVVMRGAKKGLQKALPKAAYDGAKKMVEVPKGIATKFANSEGGKLVGEVAGATQFHGLLGEFGEEQVNNIMLLSTGDTKLVGSDDKIWNSKDPQAILNLDKQIETFTGLLPMTCLFGVMGGGGYVYDKAQTASMRRQVEKFLGTDAYKKFEEGLRGNESEQKEAVRSVVQNSDLTPEQKMTALTYITRSKTDEKYEGLRKEVGTEENKIRRAAAMQAYAANAIRRAEERRTQQTANQTGVTQRPQSSTNQTAEDSQQAGRSGVQTHQQTVEEQGEPNAEDGKRTRVSFTVKLRDGSTRRGYIYDNENGFTDEEVERGAFDASNHKTAYYTDEYGEPLTLERTKPEQFTISKTTQEQDEGQGVDMLLDAAVYGDSREDVEEAQMAVLARTKPDDFTIEKGDSKRIVKVLSDESSEKSFAERMGSVIGLVKPEYQATFRKLAQEAQDEEEVGFLAEADIVELFEDRLIDEEDNVEPETTNDTEEEPEQETEEEEVVEEEETETDESRKNVVLSAIANLSKEEAQATLMEELKKAKETMDSEQMKINNIQSQVESVNTEAGMKAALEAAATRRKAILERAENKYRAILSAMKEHDQALYDNVMREEEQKKAEIEERRKRLNDAAKALKERRAAKEERRQKRAERKRRMGALLSEKTQEGYDEENERDHEGLISDLDRSIEVLSQEIAGLELRAERGFSSAEGLLYNKKRREKKREELKKFEDLREKYAEDGKSRAEGSKSVEEYIEEERNRIQQKEQEKAERAEEKERRRIENQKVVWTDYRKNEEQKRETTRRREEERAVNKAAHKEEQRRRAQERREAEEREKEKELHQEVIDDAVVTPQQDEETSLESPASETTPFASTASEAKSMLSNKVKELDADEGVKDAFDRLLNWLYEGKFSTDGKYKGRKREATERLDMLGKILSAENLEDGSALSEMLLGVELGDKLDSLYELNNNGKYDAETERAFLEEFIDAISSQIKNNDNLGGNLDNYFRSLLSTKTGKTEGEKETERKSKEEAKQERKAKGEAREAISAAREYIQERKEGGERDESKEDEDGYIKTGLYIRIIDTDGAVSGRIISAETYNAMSEEERESCEELFAVTGAEFKNRNAVALTNKDRNCLVKLNNRKSVDVFAESGSSSSDYTTIKDAVEANTAEEERKRKERGDLRSREEYDEWMEKEALGDKKVNITYTTRGVEGGLGRRLKDGKTKLSNAQVMAFIRGELTYKDLIGNSKEDMEDINRKRKTDSTLDTKIESLSDLWSVLNLLSEEIDIRDLASIIRNVRNINNKNVGIEGVEEANIEVKAVTYNGSVGNIDAWNEAATEWKNKGGEDYHIEVRTAYWVDRNGEETEPENPYAEARSVKKSIETELRKEGGLCSVENILKKLKERKNKQDKKAKTLTKAAAKKRKQAVQDLTAKGAITEEEAKRRVEEIDESTMPSESEESEKEREEEAKIAESLNEAYDNGTLSVEMVKDAIGKLGLVRANTLNLKDEVMNRISEMIMKGEINLTEVSEEEANQETDAELEKIVEEAEEKGDTVTAEMAKRVLHPKSAEEVLKEIDEEQRASELAAQEMGDTEEVFEEEEEVVVSDEDNEEPEKTSRKKQTKTKKAKVQAITDKDAGVSTDEAFVNDDAEEQDELVRGFEKKKALTSKDREELESLKKRLEAAKKKMKDAIKNKNREAREEAIKEQKAIKAEMVAFGEKFGWTREETSERTGANLDYGRYRHISMAAIRYRMEVLTHLKTLAKASGGTLEIHTLDELMDGTEPKTPFAKEIVAYAQKNGVDPAVAAEALLNERGEAQMMAGRNAGSQLTFAHGIRKPQGVDLMLLSSVIMTQSNTFGKLTSELADKNDGSVVKKVVLYGNHAYLWSTENGYDFFVEQSLAINEENYQKINDLLDTYGTDEFTENIISPIQRGKDTKTGGGSTLDALRRAGNKRYTETVRQNSGRTKQTSDRTGTNEHNLSDTQGKENGGVADNVKLMKGKSGTVYGWCETEYDENGNFVANHIYLNPKTLNSNTMVHELGHLWINLLRAKNKKLYDKGISLAKEHWLFKEYKESQEYGKLSDEEIGEEVLARLIGSGFVELSEESRTRRDASREEKEKEKETSVIYRLRKFFKEMFKELRSAFGTWTEEEIEEVTLVDLRNMALKDIISGRTVEEWAAQEIGGEALDRLERIDRALNNPDVPVPSEKKIEKAIATAEKVLLKNPGTGSAMDLFKFWGMFFKTLFKGKDLKKAWRMIDLENADGDLAILTLYEAINKYRRSVGLSGLNMEDCPYYDWEGMPVAIRNRQILASEALVSDEKNGLITRSMEATDVIAGLKFHNGEEIGEEKAKQLLDVYLMSHSAVERKSRGRKIRSGEVTFESGMLDWIKDINGFEEVNGVESLVEAVLKAKEGNEELNTALDNLWESIRNITSFYRTLMYDHGCITADLRNEWALNDFYVPNKGEMRDEALDLDDIDEQNYLSWLYRNTQRDMAKNSSRALTTKSKGGTSIGTDCLSNLVVQMNVAIAHTTRNDYRRIILYDLIENEEFGRLSGLYHIERGDNKKIHTKNTEEAKRLRTEVMHEGEMYTIVWGSNEEGADNRRGNLLIADAVNGFRNRANAPIATILKNIFSVAYTTLKLKFFLPEMLRQYKTRVSSVYINEAEKGFVHIPIGIAKATGDAIGNLPLFLKTQVGMTLTNMGTRRQEAIIKRFHSEEYKQYYREFLKYAGNSGFTSSELFADYNKLKGAIGGRTWYQKLYDILTAWQTTTDTTNRFLIFVKSRKEGMSPRDAARISRNTGPNFLKSGRGGYLAWIPLQFGPFFTATVQGIRNTTKKHFSTKSFTGRELSGSQKTSRLIAGSLAFCFSVYCGYLYNNWAVIAESLLGDDGDDDDDEKKKEQKKQLKKMDAIAQTQDRSPEMYKTNLIKKPRGLTDIGILDAFISVPEEDRVPFTIGVLLSENNNGMISDAEMYTRIAKAIIEGYVPVSNTLKSLAYSSADGLYNYYADKGTSFNSVLAQNLYDGVAQDVFGISEIGLDKGRPELALDYNSDYSAMPAAAKYYGDRNRQMSGHVARLLGEDVAGSPALRPIIGIADDVLSVLPDKERPVAEAANAYSKENGGIELNQYNVKLLRNDRHNTMKKVEELESISGEEKWYLNKEDGEIYTLVTGNKLYDKQGDSKRKSKGYGDSEENRKRKRERLTALVDIDKVIANYNPALYVNGKESKKAAAADAFEEFKVRIKKDRKENNGEPGPLEVAVVSSLAGKTLRNVADFQKGVIDDAQIALLPEESLEYFNENINKTYKELKENPANLSYRFSLALRNIYITRKNDVLYEEKREKQNK